MCAEDSLCFHEVSRSDCLAGLVIKASASRAEDLGFDSCFCPADIS